MDNCDLTADSIDAHFTGGLAERIVLFLNEGCTPRLVADHFRVSLGLVQYIMAHEDYGVLPLDEREASAERAARHFESMKKAKRLIAAIRKGARSNGSSKNV